MPDFSLRSDNLGVQVADGCGLTKTQRIYGFAICFALGCVCGLIGALTLLSMNTKGFAVAYSFWIIFMTGSTFFLIGPLRQLKVMCKRNRAPAAITFFTLTIITIIVAMSMKGTGVGLLVLILIGIQSFALLWYALTYIPFGQSMLKKSCFSCCNMA